MSNQHSPLPVQTTIVETYVGLWKQRVALLKSTWLTFSLLFVANFYLTIIQLQGPENANQGMLLTTIGVIALLSAMVAVNVNRFIVQDWVGPPGKFYFSLGPDEWRFVTAIVLLGAVFVFPMGLILGLSITAPTLPAALLVLFLTGAMIYTFVRLWLIFPVIIDSGVVDIKRAWRITDGYFWALLGTMVLGMLPPLAGMMFVSSLDLTMRGDFTDDVVFSMTLPYFIYVLIPTYLIQYIYTVVGSALSAMAYRKLKLSGSVDRKV